MSKTWQIIKYEYTRHVFEKRFIFSLLSLPVAVIAMLGVGFLIALISIDRTPIGYIDQSGVLEQPRIVKQEGGFFNPTVDFIPYQDEAQANADLEDEVIQAYYLIPEDYPESIDVYLVYFDPPGTEYQHQFNVFIRENLGLVEDLDPVVATRLSEGSLVTLVSLDETRQVQENQIFTVFLPFIAGIIFFIVVMTSGGYLMQAVVEEKENRTMEIVITSVSSTQLMTGKIIGNMSIGLTLLFIWLLFSGAGLLIGAQFFPFLQDFTFPIDYLVVMLLVLLPSFIMVAAIMSAIGATMTEIQEAQQVSGLLSLPISIPFYVTSIIMTNPNGTLAMVLSYFPLTAPITLLMRMSFTVVPLWQIVLNIAILVIFAIFGIWFAGRAFRMGMLRYGKKLSFKEILGKRRER